MGIMTKAREKVLDDIKTKRGYNNAHDVRWYWRVRGYSELLQYWVNAFQFPVALLLWFITGNYWMALGFIAVSQIYNISQNLRGLFLHIEQLIEWYIDKTI